MDGSRIRLRLDSRSLRALAHPLRARLLAALRVHGPATATALAQRLGTNSGATSYHLRQLAEAGIVVDDPDAGRGRERVWRAAHEVTSWTETELLDEDPGNAAAVEWLLGYQARATARRVDDWVDARHTWPRAWQEASSLNDERLRLTPSELQALLADVDAVLERYRALRPLDPTGGHGGDDDRRGDGDDRDRDGDPGTADVYLVVQAFPVRDLHL